MNQVAQMAAKERAALFAETAARKNISEALMEKDFWVCWVLKQLFSIEALKNRLLLKGGTSLSKVFHAINRFSEDIDLAVDYVALGFTGAKNPRQEGISRTKRQSILDEMMAVCRRYIAIDFLTIFQGRCEEILGKTDTWSLKVSDQDPNSIRFRYPAASSKNLDYVSPQVVLELGTHAEFVPHGYFTIRSYAANEFPDVIKDGEVAVTALLAKRTFWEKATILHAEFHRRKDKPMPDRYSRHYYDLAMLAQEKVRKEALGDMQLLADVVKHKETFYPSAWSRYDLAHPGGLRLVPADDRKQSLERDYKKMGVMIFGEPPAFDKIVETLSSLEKEINQ